MTGAGDAGLQFRKRGLSTIVLTDIERFDEEYGRFEVICFDAATRYESPKKALKKLGQIANLLRKKKSPRLVFKKVDSALRGHVALEVDYLLNALQLPYAVVAPSFPLLNRITVEGVHLVGGRPVAESEFGRELPPALKESSLPSLIKEETSRVVTHIFLERVRLGDRTLSQAIDTVVHEGATVITFDAATNDDLRTIARSALSKPTPPLLVGSAGLADRVAETFAHILGQRVRPSVVFAGSMASATRSQVDYATRQGAYHAMVDAKLVQQALQAKGNHSPFYQDVVGRLGKGQSVIVTTYGLREPEDDAAIKGVYRFLGKLAKEILAEPNLVAGLVLTGGEMAFQILQALDAAGVRLEGEVEPAIPFGRLIGGEFEGLPIITKAGSFGAEDTLWHCLDFMKEQ
ncbi:MAG TPA: four-carbon acid sugar kinase family protein, partial [Thermodesulfobacteriota bacterium]